MICKNCIHFKVCKDYSIYKDTIYACEDFKDGTIKNQYDRIRNMSIEEMAVMLADEIPHGDCYGCDKCELRYKPYRLNDSCQDGWLEWLETEVTE
jgi:hypothetical protein